MNLEKSKESIRRRAERTL
ncbi:MAG TPA: hypothetical protein LFW14_00470 [Rickettsia endosymbiont of Degeeriella rufa]|nr:hypothetical protein [Rickettsia endosymbiont of Degeeriella rufa]